MGQWDIDPAGVGSVLSKTGTVADGLAGQAKSYGEHLQSAATSAGGLSQGGQSGSGGGKGGGSQGPAGLVAVALAQFAQAVDGKLNFLADRTGKSMQGAVDATKAYLTGDLQMAQDAQSAALADPPIATTPPAGGKAPAGGKKPGK
ncbi:DUF6507 family protein [Kitasatospora sp. NPDC052896]|uniref:DUF6507 family protein n=1 Tax=Kitasatospora sp. NPDC052896 TaxID=3364061 RepID=UPI0037C7FAF9